jgi:hypothetical protein
MKHANRRTALTSGQKKDTDRLQRYIHREGLCSVVNRTKWAEVETALLTIPGFRPEFRVKCVREPEPTGDYWDMSFPFHIPSRVTIEWLDIDPFRRIHRGALIDDEITDFTNEVIAALRSCHVPFSRERGVIRIWGYLRPGQAPDFQ